MLSVRFAGVALALAVLAPLPVGGAPVGFAPVPVVDLNVHLPYQLTVRGRSLATASGQADPDRLRRGGAIGVVLPLVGARRGEPSVPALESAYDTLIRALSSSTALRRPGCREGRPGIRTWLSLEGSAELAREPSLAGLWAARGVRLFGLVRDEDNELATSSRLPGPVLTGLTPAGRVLVREIHRAGAMVDVTHASDMTVRDVVELAREDGARVVASHSNARQLADDPRNLGDDQLRDIASTGGVIGITFERRLLARGKEADLTDVVRQVRHVARVAGVEHVAIGSGFEGGVRPPWALVNASRYQRVAFALHQAGFTRREVRAVMAINALGALCPSRRSER